MCKGTVRTLYDDRFLPYDPVQIKQDSATNHSTRCAPFALPNPPYNSGTTLLCLRLQGVGGTQKLLDFKTPDLKGFIFAAVSSLSLSLIKVKSHSHETHWASYFGEDCNEHFALNSFWFRRTRCIKLVQSQPLNSTSAE